MNNSIKRGAVLALALSQVSPVFAANKLTINDDGKKKIQVDVSEFDEYEVNVIRRKNSEAAPVSKPAPEKEPVSTPVQHVPVAKPSDDSHSPKAVLPFYRTEIPIGYGANNLTVNTPILDQYGIKVASKEVNTTHQFITAGVDTRLPIAKAVYFASDPRFIYMVGGSDGMSFGGTGRLGLLVENDSDAKLALEAGGLLIYNNDRAIDVGNGFNGKKSGMLGGFSGKVLFAMPESGFEAAAKYNFATGSYDKTLAYGDEKVNESQPGEMADLHELSLELKKTINDKLALTAGAKRVISNGGTIDSLAIDADYKLDGKTGIYLKVQPSWIHDIDGTSIDVEGGIKF